MGPSKEFSLFTLFERVVDFHERFGIDYEGPPRALPIEVLNDRLNFLEEETREFRSNALIALGNEGSEGHRESLAEMADGLVDIVYVALGTAHLMGLDFDEAFHRVHVSNMKKQVDHENRDDGKQGIYKPEGWQRPDLRDLVDEE